jgi:drug/metabolite transporter (DMT)-like permease
MERFGWLALVFLTWGPANFLLKVVGERLDGASGALGIVVGYLIAGSILAASGGARFGLSWVHAGAVAIGACYIVGNWAFLHLARTEDVTALAPLAQLAVLIPVVLGFALLGEPVTPRKLAGIAFGVIAIVLLARR